MKNSVPHLYVNDAKNVIHYYATQLNSTVNNLMFGKDYPNYKNDPLLSNNPDEVFYSELELVKNKIIISEDVNHTHTNRTIDLNCSNMDEFNLIVNALKDDGKIVNCSFDNKTAEIIDKFNTKWILSCK